MSDAAELSYPTAAEYHEQLVTLALAAFDRMSEECRSVERSRLQSALRERMAQAAQVYAMLLEEAAVCDPLR